MTTNFSTHPMVSRISGIFNRFFQDGTPISCPHEAQLYREIERLERSLAKVSTKPIRAFSRKSFSATEEVSERQRLIDLAG